MRQHFRYDRIGCDAAVGPVRFECSHGKKKGVYLAYRLGGGSAVQINYMQENLTAVNRSYLLILTLPLGFTFEFAPDSAQTNLLTRRKMLELTL